MVLVVPAPTKFVDPGTCPIWQNLSHCVKILFDVIRSPAIPSEIKGPANCPMKHYLSLSLSPTYFSFFFPSMTELEKDINNLRTGLKSVETVSAILSFSLQLQQALQLMRSSSDTNVSIYITAMQHHWLKHYL